jgi:uncharacterized membrane protein
MRSIKPNLLMFSSLSALVLSMGALSLGAPEIINSNFDAQARSSGGRSGGGSFRSSPPSRSSGSSGGSSTVSPSPSYNQPSNRNYDSNYGRSGGTTIIAPIVPIYGGGGGGNYNNSPNYRQSNPQQESNSGFGIVVIIFVLILGGVSIFLLYRLFQNMTNGGGEGVSSGNREIDNNRVSIHKLQVALLSQAREVQSRLTEISSTIDTDTPEGLHTLLQESVVALLRTPENWAYVLASVESSDRTQAEGIFNQLSITERTKFSEESLVNVGGKMRRNSSAIAQPDKDPAAYIVVTLLIGTAHDQPLFKEVKTQADLTQALNKIALIPEDYLLIFELLWTPQAETDSLTYDEMLTEYTDMKPI